MALQLTQQLVRGACRRSNRASMWLRADQNASREACAAYSAAKSFSSSADPGIHPERGSVDDSRREDAQPEHLSEDGPFQRTARWQTKCPFWIRRTSSDNLPVYLQKRLNGNVAMTVIRKVRGNDKVLRKELEVLCQKKVHVGRSGYLEIMGNHVGKVKAYLKSIGY
mmetsp:Transcript_60454/g.136070  ORF Transcript_60454/g.136070 Transcript_60454/m.136070 type:complete len:167 (-) Transcript_60454:24-524(-)